jgi:hypothetical protein
MLLLTGTSDLIQIITSTTADIYVHISYVDRSGDTITPDRKNTNISSAATTTVVTSPTTGVQRNVQTMIIRNGHASSSNQITIVHTDGTTAVSMFQTTLAFGEFIQYLDGVGFQVFSNAGSIKQSINQGSNTVSSSMSSVVLTGDVINNNVTANTIANVTGLEFPVVAGKTYYFKFFIPYTSAATTTGSRWSINGPAFTTLRYRSDYTITATTTTDNYASAYDTPAASNASSLTNGNVAVIEGVIQPSANGSVVARFASEITNSAITAKAGSVCYYQEII